MPNRLQWEPRFSVANEILDTQHKDFLEQCNALADCLDQPGEAGKQTFTRIFAELMTSARAHFATEEKLLADYGYPDLEDHRSEQEEFEFLAAEIMTTENFDQNELQNFLALWWAGHIIGAAKNYPDFAASPHRRSIESESSQLQPGTAVPVTAGSIAESEACVSGACRHGCT
jgi:hemerythrin